VDLEDIRLSLVSTAKRPLQSENCFEKFPAKLADFCACPRGTGFAPRGSVAAATSPVAASSSSWVLDSGPLFM
jgi:hypothetical protein